MEAFVADRIEDKPADNRKEAAVSMTPVVFCDASCAAVAEAPEGDRRP